MSEPIRIGDQEFQPVRQTYAALVALTPKQQAVEDLRDELIGLQTQLGHAERQIFELEDAAGEFDVARLQELKAKRKELRTAATKIGVEYFSARIEMIAIRLDPQPDVPFLLEELDDAELERVLEELNRPTQTTSDSSSATS